MTWVWRLCWKESREQMWVFIIIALVTWLLVSVSVAALAPAGAESVRSDPILRDALTTLLLVMTIAYASVAGGILFASDRENRTQMFFDMLPVSRGAKWLTKALFGVVLVLAQTGILFGVGVLYRLGYDIVMPWQGYLIFLAYMAVAAFAWASLMANYSPTVLHAAGFSLLLFPTSWLAGPVLRAMPVLGPILCLTMPLGVLALARVQYCHTPGGQRLRQTGRKRFRISAIRALVWLCWRQGRGLLLTLLVGAVLGGITWLSTGLFFWPLASALVGIMAGLMVFAGEQLWGTERFLGEQRFPRRLVWGTKFGFWVSGSMVAVGVMFLTGAITFLINSADASQTNSRVFETRVMSLFIHPVYYLTLGYLYGFTFGLVFSQILKKTIVALVVSVIVTFLALLAWWPSLTCGGLPWWQVYLPPVGLIAASYCLYRPWVGGWLMSQRSALSIIAVFLGIGLWIAGCLWYRSVEIPMVGEPVDESEFMASLPQGEKNSAKEPIRNALAEMRQQEQNVLAEVWHIGGEFGAMGGEGGGPAQEGGGAGGPAQEGGGPMPGPGDEGAANEVELKVEKPFEEQLNELVDDPSGPISDKLQTSLDKIFAGTWDEDLSRAVKLPLGMLDQPVRFGRLTNDDVMTQGRQAGVLLVCRAIQLAKKDQWDDAWADWQTTFRLANHLRSHTGWYGLIMGCVIERFAATSLREFLPKLKMQPDLLRQIQTLLDAQERSRPDLEEMVKANHLEWQVATSKGYYDIESSGRVIPELRVQKYAQLVPWEKQRNDRIAGLLYASQLWQAKQPLWKIRDFWNEVSRNVVPEDKENPAAALSAAQWNRLAQHRNDIWLSYPPIYFSGQTEAHALNAIRLAQIEVAKLRYFADRNRSPKTIADLVPQYLPAVPINAKTGEPFTLESGKMNEE